MKSRFIEYLQNIPAYAVELQTAAQSKNPNQKDNIYVKSLLSVALAEAGQMSKLARIFNDYPITFEIEDKQETESKKTLHAVEPPALARVVQASLKLFVPNAFIMENETAYVPSNQTVKNDLQNYISLLIQFAASELLDTEGNLRPEIISFFKLDPIINIYKADPEKLDHIKFQVLFSYISQILMGAALPIIQQALIDQNKAEELQTLGLLSVISMYYLYHSDGTIAPFFKYTVLNFIYDQSVFSEKAVADMLEHITPNTIQNIVALDISSMIEDLNDYSDLYKQLLDNRASFWLNVMGELKNAGDMLRYNAIQAGLPNFAKDKLKLRDTVSNGLNEVKLQPSSIGASTEIQGEDEKEIKEQALPATTLVSSPKVTTNSLLNEFSEYQLFTKWFNNRDNNFIIDHLIHIQAISPEREKPLKRSSLEGSETKSADNNRISIFDELTKIKYETHLATLPTKEFFQAIYMQVENKEQFFTLLQNTLPEMAFNLNIHQGEDNPLSIAIKVGKWDQVLRMLINMRKVDEVPEENAEYLAANTDKLSTEFIKFLKTLKNDNERFIFIERVVKLQNVLGNVLMTTDSGIEKQLEKTFPKVMKTFKWQNANDDDTPLSIALKMEEWDLVINILLNLPKANLKDINPEELALINKNRHGLATGLIVFLQAHFKDELSKQLDYLDSVISGKNALGSILHEPTNALGFKISAMLFGKKVTDSIGILLKERVSLVDKLEKEEKKNEEKKEIKSGSQPPTPKHL